MAQPEEMYQCQTVNCGYIYDPDRGDRKGKIKKGVAFQDIYDDWRCPVCGATKAAFKPLAGPGSVIEENKKLDSQSEDTLNIEDNMDKYQCLICFYEYEPKDGDPGNGVKPGTSFDDLPDDWVCPVCGADKDQFEKM